MSTGLRIDLIVAKDIATDLKSRFEREAPTAHEGAKLQVREAAVSGQSVEFSEITKLVVTLVGGGTGIAAILKALANAISDVLRTRRGKAELQMPDGTRVSLENYTPTQIAEVLSRLPGTRS